MHKLINEILAGHEDGHLHEEGHDTLHACAEELIEAIHSKDVAGAVAALKAIFEELDSEPHAEGPHTEEE